VFEKLFLPVYLGWKGVDNGGLSQRQLVHKYKIPRSIKTIIQKYKNTRPIDNLEERGLKLIFIARGIRTLV